jgi:hypothetical protein
MTNDPRTIELLKWENETHTRLAAPVADILALEDAGHVVDLVTGDVLLHGADSRPAATPFGQAVAAALDGEVTP